METKSKELKEQKSYLVGFGSIIINRYKDFILYKSKDKNSTLRDFIKYDDENFKERIKSCFEGSSEVSFCEEIELFEADDMTTPMDLENKELVTRFRNPFHLKLSINDFSKEKMLIMGLFENRSFKLKDSFYLVFDGENFLYYRQCEIGETSLFEGSLIREILEEILSKSFDVKIRPPCPIRQDFFFISGNRNTRNKNYFKDAEKNMIFNRIKNPKTFFSKVLINESFCLSIFYKGQQIIEKVNDIDHSFNKEFSEIFKEIKELEFTRLNNLFFKRLLVEKIKIRFIKLNMLIGNYIILLSYLNENKKLLKKVIENTLLERIENEFLEEYNFERLNYENLIKTFPVIRNCIEDYHQKRSLRWTIAFSLISAIVGALITYLLLGI